jgi:hypothetical protein
LLGRRLRRAGCETPHSGSDPVPTAKSSGGAPGVTKVAQPGPIHRCGVSGRTSGGSGGRPAGDGAEPAGLHRRAPESPPPPGQPRHSLLVQGCSPSTPRGVGLRSRGRARSLARKVDFGGTDCRPDRAAPTLNRCRPFRQGLLACTEKAADLGIQVTSPWNVGFAPKVLAAPKSGVCTKKRGRCRKSPRSRERTRGLITKE